MKSTGKIIITIIALWAGFGAYIFDISPSHIFNPSWTAHAKYHNAQGMLLGTCVGLLSVWVLWFEAGNALVKLRLSLILAALYFATQIGAIFFPGTALFDPGFAPPGNIPVQLIMDAALLLLLAVAYILEQRRIKRLNL